MGIFVQLSLYSLIHSSLHSCIFYLFLFRTSLLFQRKHDCMGIAVRFFFLLHPVRLFIQTNFAKKEKKNCICASIIPSKKKKNFFLCPFIPPKKKKKKKKKKK